MASEELGLIALLFTVAACYEHTYHIGAGAPMGTVTYDLSADEVERIVTTSHFLDWVGAMAPDRLREASEAQQALADS